MKKKPKINMAAQELGRLGGKARSAKKAKSSRENGKLGGRPPKTKAKLRTTKK